MLYLIESGMYIKIGYTKDWKALEQRFHSYKTHNPNFTMLDVAKGTKEDEKRLQAEYKKYSVGEGEWCYTKKLVVDLWIKYKDSYGYVDYYQEFCRVLNDTGDGIVGYGSHSCNTRDCITKMEAYIEAKKLDYISKESVDLFEEFKKYYEEKENKLSD